MAETKINFISALASGAPHHNESEVKLILASGGGHVRRHKLHVAVASFQIAIVGREFFDAAYCDVLQLEEDQRWRDKKTMKC